MFSKEKKKMKKQHLTLLESDREKLENLLSKGSLNVRVQKRALALLELDRGKTIAAVVVTLDLSYVTVHGWVKKYQSAGLDFVQDKPRSGRPPGFTLSDCTKITALACSEVPAGRCQWSLRLLADRAVELELVERISHTEVGLILKKMNYSPTASDNGASGS